MRIFIITQDEPFYLYELLEDLILNFRPRHEIVGIACQSGSPFGKNLSFTKRCLATYQIFGAWFFVYFGIKLIFRKYIKKRTISHLCKHYDVELYYQSGSINTTSFRTIISELRCDVGISVSGKEIFKELLISTFPKGILNLHTSKLPSYRGLMPVFWALKNGEKAIGVSVFKVDSGIDTGQLLIQKIYPVYERNLDRVIRDTKGIGATALVEAVDTLLNNNDEKIVSSAPSSYNSFPTRDEVIQFKKRGNRLF